MAKKKKPPEPNPELNLPAEQPIELAEKALLEGPVYQQVLSCLKGHGGKRYSAQWVVSHFPPRDWYDIFCDAMCRTCAVLLAHDPVDKGEIVIDIDRRITNFWRQLRRRKSFEEMQQQLNCVPFSEDEFVEARARLATVQRASTVEDAIDFFILARQSLAARENAFAPMSRSRTRGGMLEQTSAWLSAIEHLPAVHARMQRVGVLCRDSIKFLRRYLKAPRKINQTTGELEKKVLIYLDPPYHPCTRTHKTTYGDHDWDEVKHADFLSFLDEHKNKAYFCVSGYDCDQYKKALGSWRQDHLVQPVHSSGAKDRHRTASEVLWMNY